MLSLSVPPPEGRSARPALRRAGPLLVLFALALVPRVAYLQHLHGGEPPRLSPDESRYLAYASTLETAAVYGQTADTPSALDPPLYPLFIAAIGQPSRGELDRVLWLQIVLGAAAACIAYLAADRLAGKAAGWIAGGLFAAYLPATKISARFLTENQAIFLLLLTVLLARAWLRKESTGGSTAAGFGLGALLGLLALTRIVTAPLVLGTAPFALLDNRRSWRRRVGLFLLPLVGFTLFYSPWVVRNALTLGELEPLTTSSSDVLAFSRLSAEHVAEGHGLEEARRLARARLNDEEEPSRAIEPRHVLQRLTIMLGVHRALELPFPFAGQHVPAPVPLRQLIYLWWPIVLTGLVAAVTNGLTQRRWDLLLAVALPAGIVVAHALVHAIPRYQIVPYAGWTVASGVGWSLLLSASIGRFRSWRMARAA